MATIYRYEYGQTARVASQAPPSIRPGERVAVVGMRTIDNALASRETGYPIGTPLYLIEYDDGSSREVPEQYIQASD